MACGNDFSVALVEEGGSCCDGGNAIYVFGSNLVGQVRRRDASL